MKKIALLLILALLPSLGFARTAKLDPRKRAQKEGWAWTIHTTPKAFRAMQRAYRPQSFGRWSARLKSIRYGMTVAEATKILTPRSVVPDRIVHNGASVYTFHLDDAYYVGFMVNLSTQQIGWEVATPWAITYDIRTTKSPP